MKNKKKVALLLTVTSTSLLCASALVLVSKNLAGSINAQEVGSEMLFDRNALIVEKDMGYLHQSSLKNNKIDLIGYEAVTGKFAKISKKTYNDGTKDVTYKGMIYNRSIINGFESITVNYEGDQLFVKFSDYLMEDMNFDGINDQVVVSGTSIYPASGKAYFVLYTNGTATIDSLDIKYACDGSADASMLYSKNSELVGARSRASKEVHEDSYLELTNNPTINTNNYSVGNHLSQTNADTWYRWNGREYKESEDLGDSFTIQMTVLGNISQALNKRANEEDNWFHYGIWPEFTLNTKDAAPAKGYWVMSYIGNDNYEPLGKDNPDRIHTDTYGDYSYAGRFFTRYDNFGTTQNPNWQFADPDLFTVMDGDTTLREAYERYELPFWNIEYKINNGYVENFINGFLVDAYDLEEEYNPEVNSWSINRLCMHLVNFGNIEERSDGRHEGANKYEAMLTIPRIIKN